MKEKKFLYGLYPMESCSLIILVIFSIKISVDIVKIKERSNIICMDIIKSYFIKHNVKKNKAENRITKNGKFHIFSSNINSKTTSI